MTVTVNVPQRVIRAADRRAQRRLHRVLVEQSYADPNNRTTRLYHEAERLMDRLVGDDSRNAWDAIEWRAAVDTGSYSGAVGIDAPLAYVPDGRSFDPVLTPDPGDHYLRPTGTAS